MIEGCLLSSHTHTYPHGLVYMHIHIFAWKSGACFFTQHSAHEKTKLNSPATHINSGEAEFFFLVWRICQCGPANRPHACMHVCIHVCTRMHAHANAYPMRPSMSGTHDRLKISPRNDNISSVKPTASSNVVQSRMSWGEFSC